ncbi:MAG: hypothetical protein M3Q58_05965 [Bacteroidota bacterium]|nr:hypothetical protein [Bacteroidota bacterium]
MCLLLAITGFFLVANSAYAQKINWGETNEAKSSKYRPKILGEDEDNIYTVASINKDVYIERFDKKKKKEQFSQKIEFPKINGNKTFYEGINFIDGKFLLFVSYFDKKKDMSVIFAYTLSGKDGKKIGKDVEVFNIPVEKKKRSGTFYFFRSEDRTKIVVNHVAYYKKQKEVKDKYKLLDTDLNVLVEREDVTKNSEKRDYTTQNYILDNDGSIYYMKNYNDGRKHIVSYEANRSYEKWEEAIDTKKIGLGPKDFITNINFIINRNNDLVITGYYNKEKTLEGCFFMKINNQSKEIEFAKINIFDKKFKDQFKSDKQLEKGKDVKMYNVFRSVDILTKKDGGVVLCGEFYQHTEYYHNGRFVGERFHYGDMVVLNMDGNGVLSWAHRIPKKQIYHYNFRSYPLVIGSFGVRLFFFPTIRTTDYFSYLAGIDNEKAYIMFNDNPKNSVVQKDNEQAKALRNLDKAAVTLYSINLETGKKTEKLFTGAKDYEITLKPKVSYQKDQDSEIISFGMKKKKFKYGNISLL